MKNIVNVIRTKVNKIAIFLQIKAESVAAAIQERNRALSADNAGFTEAVEKAIFIIGAVVIGSAIIVALLALFTKVLLPEISKKIEAIFNFT